ncbi:hypothetical protein DFH29DRAFT_1030000 [Suillus ampliporus]|nr:hypothetical protein DFH29DRAFT_1030000 [Suillus ampliporus]
MDSQITLVGSDTEPELEIAAPDPAFGATTILDFDGDVIISTNATVRGKSSTRYSVRTVRAGLVGLKNPKTVFSQGERILATVQRRDMVPDSLTLGSKSTSLGSWLKTPMFSTFPVWFSEGGETYLWKEGQNGGISLYKGSSTGAIARFHPSEYSVTHDRGGITYRAHLDLRPEADLIREKVFISCMLVVQKTRKNARKNAKENVKENVKEKERDLESASQGLMYWFLALPQ